MITQKTAGNIAKLIHRLAGNTVFSVHFSKRTTGEERTMICRFTPSIDHTGPTRQTIRQGILIVWDMQKRGYRSIPLDSIKWIKIRGKVYP